MNPAESIDRARAAQTIAAIASPPGGARRGIVRLSGPGAREIVEACARFESDDALASRGVWPARFHDGRGEQPVLVFWMPAPRSYTREDVVELHGWGARPLIEAVLRRVLELGARPAAPGEFTRRAFENGQLDLTRAEGVLELVRASNERERRAASALLSGGLARRVEALRDRLLDLRVLCEASLDFDEADTGHVPSEQIDALAGEALGALESALGFERRRAPPTGRARIVLAGAPNAGKSTLFNALCGARALVSELPGATRDVLRANWRAGELEFELIDTAGLVEAGASAAPTDAPRDDSADDHSDDPDDDPDLQAQAASREALASADLVLALASASASQADQLEQLAARRAAGELGAAPLLLVWSQIDRPDARREPPAELLERLGAPPWVAVSACSGAGLEQLAQLSSETLFPGAADSVEDGIEREVSERHLLALAESHTALGGARNALRAGAPLDQVAQTVRVALDALDGILGRTSPEDVLERLFARFCIGK